MCKGLQFPLLRSSNLVAKICISRSSSAFSAWSHAALPLPRLTKKFTPSFAKRSWREKHTSSKFQHKEFNSFEHKTAGGAFVLPFPVAMVEVRKLSTFSVACHLYRPHSFLEDFNCLSIQKREKE